MNCEEVRELLPAYVVGKLERDEVQAVEEHIRAGREHDDELVELRATVFALDRFADDLRQEAPVPIDARRPQLHTEPRKVAWLGRLSVLPAWPLAAAAVVVLAVLGLGVLASGLTDGDGSKQVTLLVEGAPGQSVSLTGATDAAQVSVTMSGFERLPSDRAYQLWAIRDEQWLRIGVCNTNAAGGWTGNFDFTVRPGEQIALTVEPAGGSVNPTTAPILTSKS